MKKAVILALVLGGAGGLYAQSAEEIVARMDGVQSFQTSRQEGRVITTDRFGVKEVDFLAWSRGNAEFLIEFTSAAERGQKILRTSSELFLYYPDAQELIRLQGAALRQSMMGSDISYEDMTEGKDTLSKYDAALLGEEEVEGLECFVIKLVAKTRKVPYPRQTLWVEKGSFLPRKALYFSRTEKLLKEMRVLETRSIGAKVMITRMVWEDKTKSDSSTELVIKEAEVDFPLEEDFFSLDRLSW